MRLIHLVDKLVMSHCHGTRDLSWILFTWCECHWLGIVMKLVGLLGLGLGVCHKPYGPGKEKSCHLILYVGTTLNSICKGMGLFGKGFQTIVFSV